MRLRNLAIAAVAFALTLTTGLAVEAGQGKVLKIDPAANVVVLEDGTMYRMVPDTVILVEDKPVTFDALEPGILVVIRSGESVQLKDGQYIIISPSASPPTR